MNTHTSRFDKAIRSACGFHAGTTIEWSSPLANDEHAEYRDEDFLKKLGVALPNRPLSDFWPTLGPQWDALGRTHDGQIILVEAKANVPEMISDGTGASEPSKRRIDAALTETKEYLGVDPSILWSGKLYQYANRLAHLYLLRQLNKVPAWLVFVYFVGDNDVHGPSNVAEWESAIAVVRGVLGIGGRNRLSRYVRDVFIPIGAISGAAVAADRNG